MTSLRPILHEIKEQFYLSRLARADIRFRKGTAYINTNAKNNIKRLWNSEQWWEAFVFMFYFSPFVRTKSHYDDLLFFVLAEYYRKPDDLPYIVRRKTDELPEDMYKTGDKFHTIDWCATVALNLVVQTGYYILVAVCSAEGIPYVDNTDEMPSEYGGRVIKNVFASPTSMSLSDDHSKAEDSSAPSVCYPDICFAIEDFEKELNSLVISKKGQYYCIMLSAYDGIAIREKGLIPHVSNPNMPGSSNPSKTNEDTGDVMFQDAEKDDRLREKSSEGPSEEMNELQIEVLPKEDTAVVEKNVTEEDATESEAKDVIIENAMKKDAGIEKDVVTDGKSDLKEEEKNEDDGLLEDEDVEVVAEKKERKKNYKAMGVRVFSGFVMYDELKNKIVEMHYKNGNIQSLKSISMKGPENIGMAQVAFEMKDEEKQELRNTINTIHAANKKKGLKSFVRESMKHFMVNRQHENQQLIQMDLSLQCSLMNLSIPIFDLVNKILEPLE